VKIGDFARNTRADVAAPLRAGARGRARGAHLPDRRLERPRGRLLLVDGRRLSRHLLHQLARPCARHQALRDGRRFAQQLAARGLHHGRGLAQQPPRLSGQRPAGFSLVGDRPRPSTS
jgi:hypothetical protein